MINKAERPIGIYTIGHSNHELTRFIELLLQHHVEAVVDVRSMPYSRRQPQFNRDKLGIALKEHGIAYVFLGQELGARSENPECYENGRVQYQKLARTEEFQSGIQRVMDGSRKMRVALMCAEKDPLECHRTILVARELVGLGNNINHIHADGKLETHPDAMKRLCKRFRLSELDLFKTPEEQDNEAYAAQEERIAYVRKERTAEAQGAQK